MVSVRLPINTFDNCLSWFALAVKDSVQTSGPSKSRRRRVCETKMLPSQYVLPNALGLHHHAPIRRQAATR